MNERGYVLHSTSLKAYPPGWMVNSIGKSIGKEDSITNDIQSLFSGMDYQTTGMNHWN